MQCASRGDLRYRYAEEIRDADTTTQRLPDMLKRPFRTPFRTPFANTPCDIDDSGPQLKKRRISNDQPSATPPGKSRLVFKTPGISSLPRKPLSTIENPPIASERTELDKDGSDKHFTVLWYVHHGSLMDS